MWILRAYRQQARRIVHTSQQRKFKVPKARARVRSVRECAEWSSATIRFEESVRTSPCVTSRLIVGGLRHSPSPFDESAARGDGGRVHARTHVYTRARTHADNFSFSSRERQQEIKCRLPRHRRFECDRIARTLARSLQCPSRVKRKGSVPRPRRCHVRTFVRERSLGGFAKGKKKKTFSFGNVDAQRVEIAARAPLLAETFTLIFEIRARARAASNDFRASRRVASRIVDGGPVRSKM